MIEIIIPEKKSLNKILRMNYHKKVALQDLFSKEVMVAKNQQKLKPIEGYPLNFIYTFYIIGKELDAMNLAGMSKMLEDGLRYNGILKNDRPKFVSSVKLVAYKSCRKYNYCIITYE